jgi:hypothetical protein
MKIKPFLFVFFKLLLLLHWVCLVCKFSVEVVGDSGGGDGTTFCKLPLLLNQEMLFLLPDKYGHWSQWQWQWQ